MSRRFRYLAEYAGYRAATGAIARSSPEGARRIGHRLGSLAYRLDARRRRLALANLELALPELSEAERRRVARDSFRGFGAAACEALVAGRLGPAGIVPRIAVESWEPLDRALAGGRGAFLMSAHFGAWEIASYAVGARVSRLHLLARPPNNPRVAAHLQALRERWGHRQIAKQGAGLRMLRAVRRGEVVGLLIDQRVRPAQGVRVPFFGREVWATPMLAYLSLRTGTPVVPLFCRPEGAGGYRLRLGAAITPDATEPSEEAQAVQSQTVLTARYLEVIEAEIRRDPGLWLWPHRRWEL